MSKARENSAARKTTPSIRAVTFFRRDAPRAPKPQIVPRKTANDVARFILPHVPKSLDPVLKAGGITKKEHVEILWRELEAAADTYQNAKQKEQEAKGLTLANKLSVLEDIAKDATSLKRAFHNDEVAHALSVMIHDDSREEPEWRKNWEPLDWQTLTAHLDELIERAKLLTAVYKPWLRSRPTWTPLQKLVRSLCDTWRNFTDSPPPVASGGDFVSCVEALYSVVEPEDSQDHGEAIKKAVAKLRRLDRKHGGFVWTERGD